MVVSSAMRIGTQEFTFRSGMVTPVVHETRDWVATKDKGHETATEGGEEVVERDGWDGGRQGHVASGQERRFEDEWSEDQRSGSHQREEAGSGKAASERQGGKDDDVEAEPEPSAIRGRGRNGPERLDNAWSGLKWRGRPSRKQPNKHWTRPASPLAMPR